MNLLLFQIDIWYVSVLRSIYTIGLKKSFDISRIQRPIESQHLKFIGTADEEYWYLLIGTDTFQNW